MSGTPPEGWDQIPQQLLDGAKELRMLFISFIVSGFTSQEAAMIVAHLVAANNQATST